MSLSDSDLWIAFAISSVSVLILLLFRRPILIYLFDPDIATTLGIPSRLISYGIFTLIILVLVSSLQAVGAFLTLGLLVGPAATVYMLTNKPSHLFWGAESSVDWAPCWPFTCPFRWAGTWAQPSFWCWEPSSAQPTCIHHGAGF